MGVDAGEPLPEGALADRPRLRVRHGGVWTELQSGVVPSAGYAGMSDTTLADATDPRRGLRLDGGGTTNSGVLVKFDLSSPPPRARILSASLVFHVLAASDESYAVHEALRP